MGRHFKIAKLKTQEISNNLPILPLNRTYQSTNTSCSHYTLPSTNVLVYIHSPGGVHNPCGICKLERWSPYSPLVCIGPYHLYKNLKLHFLFFGWRWYYVWWSKFSWFNTSPKEVFVLAQSSSKIPSMTHFLAKPPHILKMLAKTPPYLLQKKFKPQSHSWM